MRVAQWQERRHERRHAHSHGFQSAAKERRVVFNGNLLNSTGGELRL